MALGYGQIMTSDDPLQSLIRTGRLPGALKERGAAAAAIVNTRLYGVLPFAKALTETGIHPVIGLSVEIETTAGVLPAFIYAKDDQGYRNLLKISSAQSVREREGLPLQWLKGYRDGCLVMADPAAMGEGDPAEALGRVLEAAGEGRLVMGISRRGGQQHPAEDDFVRFAETAGLPVCAVAVARYERQEEAFAFRVARLIAEGSKLAEAGEGEDPDACLLSPHQLAERFGDRPDWVEAAAEILLSCAKTVPEPERLMPAFPLDEGESADGRLRTDCLAGLERRLGETGPAYADRLDHELGVIARMGYSDYFLIVADFIAFASSKGILTGPGRGSSAGSLVAFALGITDVDPLAYGLIFERFLNPERVTMPDIDVDFADHRRHEVIDYVARKYGEEHVAQIITFGTLSAKAAARSTARIFGFSEEEQREISRMIPGRPGVSLKEAAAEGSPLARWVGEEPVRLRWMQTALAVEGIPRNVSTHAAGVVLSPVPLVEAVPVEAGSDGGVWLTQWPMKEVEERGLLKMDFLGLRNLTLLERIRAMILHDRKEFLDFERIPLDDPAAIRLFQEGDMTGIFQFESDGMRDTLRRIRPGTFRDIYAINALYRPGPMDNIPVFERRMHGREPIPSIHPSIDPVLRETYGIIVYQEQIMQIAVRMAGFSMGEADILRRAVSKKKRSVLEQERNHFVEGATGLGHSRDTALRVYDYIVKFADYGFPKSHAVAYSLISFRLAWLKANEPAYFYAALISQASGDPDRASRIIQEARRKGLSILAPSVLKSGYACRVEGGAIRLGLSSVKGVPAPFIRKLLDVRKNSGRWADLFEMAVALSARNFTRGAVEPLAKAGALDEFHPDRAVLLASIGAAETYAELVRPDEEDDLFGGDPATFGRQKYSKAGELPEPLRLQYEREVLGFYLSEHPASGLKQKRPGEFTDLGLVDGTASRLTVAGIILEIKRIRTKKGEAMAFLTLQDDTGELPCTLFPKEYTKFNRLLNEGSGLIASGQAERRNGKIQMIIKEIQE
ncbi:DNA polymerase III subunit alpha [Edaphobacillus lindanitolerans]|uniref:DNA-directed DNA polymerase n=1 Tax=Edaphobacillus lindanitolerans TaxID=550447 RepID=A0A1U7PQS9_9BACI|nr:DNA polymerase III subunit alpha [Edaphobacillus lindanitolerans]SIT85059.1 DNA polymerase-3 subunit alpha [Edaphobacillus lindanitolerans]